MKIIVWWRPNGSQVFHAMQKLKHTEFGNTVMVSACGLRRALMSHLTVHTGDLVQDHMRLGAYKGRWQECGHCKNVLARRSGS